MSDCKEFKQVVDLKHSGLLVFLHNDKTKQCKNRNYSTNSIILHNTGERDLRRFDYIAELCQYRTKCFKCKRLIQYARTLLDDLDTIRKNEILGICEICKKFHKIKQCPRCEYIVEKYINKEIEIFESRQILFNTWLCNVRDFLLGLTNEPNTLYDFYFRKECLLKLKDALETLSYFLSEQNINVLTYLDADKIRLLKNENMKILEDLLIKFQSSKCSEVNSELEKKLESLMGDLDVANKHLMCNNDKIYDSQSTQFLTQENHEVNLKNENSLTAISSTKKEVENLVLTDSKNISKKSYTKNQKTIKKNIIENKRGIDIKKLNNKNTANISSSTKELSIIKKMKKDKRPLDIKIGTLKEFKESSKVHTLSEINDIEKETIIDQEINDSILDCKTHTVTSPREMIKDNNIVKYDHHYKNTCDKSVKPLLFKTNEFIDTERDHALNHTIVDQKNHKTIDKKIFSGIVTYKLSNPEFINNGWTILPSTKILRKINIYKTTPAQSNWFEKQKKATFFYNSGEKLAEVHASGGGIWFYKNGSTALDCYNAKELNISQRYVIYSSGELDEASDSKAKTVLACFDSLGNGVVYDHSSNIRLKYNQSDGVVVDAKIGPPGRWKWHTLNDPPELHEVFIDNYDKEPMWNEDEKKTINKTNLDGEGNTKDEKNKEVDEEMIAIEFENVLKEKAKKLLKKFKPVDVKMKALKINNYFSLRILDQTKIYILFKCGYSHLKLDLGMNLISNKIIDTCVAEVSEVPTPYDRFIRRSKTKNVSHKI